MNPNHALSWSRSSIYGNYEIVFRMPSRGTGRGSRGNRWRSGRSIVRRMRDDRRCYWCQERGHIQYSCPWNWQRTGGNRERRTVCPTIEEVPARQIAVVLGQSAEQEQGTSEEYGQGAEVRETSDESRPVAEVRGTRRSEGGKRIEPTASEEPRIWPVIDLTDESEGLNGMTTAESEPVEDSTGVAVTEEWQDLVAGLDDVEELGEWLDIVVEESEWGSLWEE
ncbi:unnamed protein product [Gordionus sp. m RMFG-2023]